MRRWLVILLLALLPVQFSWSAVADYCVHEPGAAADHVGGHHDHASHGHDTLGADSSDKGKTDSPSSTATHFDCGHCHGHCVGMVEVVASLEPRALGTAPPALRDASCAEPAPGQPERPQWTPLA